MSYQRERLSTLAYANGFTHWHYMADGDHLPNLVAIRDLERELQAGSSLFRAGDLITVSVVTDLKKRRQNVPGSTAIVFMLAVTSKDHGLALAPVAMPAPSPVLQAAE